MLGRALATLLLLLTAGCSSPAATRHGPDPPVSTWAPPVAPRALVVALHGFNDHKAAFSEFGVYAAMRGVLVKAYDQPGFGERADRGRWPGTEALVAELLRLIRAERARHPDLPMFVLGESMGAAVAVAALARAEALPVAGVILAAPAVWDDAGLPRAYRLALRLIATVLPPLRVSGKNLNLLASDNIEMLRALGRDPFYLRETRIDAVAGLVELMELARRQAPALTAPTLVLLGGRDEIVPIRAARSFAATLKARPCLLVTYLNGWHLLLRDHQRLRVFDDVLAWIERAPLPSRLDRPCAPALA